MLALLLLASYVLQLWPFKDLQHPQNSNSEALQEHVGNISLRLLDVSLDQFENNRVSQGQPIRVEVSYSDVSGRPTILLKVTSEQDVTVYRSNLAGQPDGKGLINLPTNISQEPGVYRVHVSYGDTQLASTSLQVVQNEGE